MMADLPPKLTEGATTMKQKLILPINHTLVTASYKNEAYWKKFGFRHYGTDFVSTAGSTLVYASGVGTLIASGWDENAGYVAIIRYPGAYNHRQRRYEDVVFRYYHLNSLAALPAGENAITKDTEIGHYGGSGFGSMTRWSPHLHVEADTDLAYPAFSPTFAVNGSIIKGTVSGANDRTTLSCLEYLYCKKSAPDFQTFRTAGDIYINSADKTIPILR